MKKKILAIICAVMLLASCGSDMMINGEKVKTVGIINTLVDDPTLFDVKKPGIQYKVIWGNVVWGIILIETVIAPIYFFGFSMFEPVDVKK
jgi:hypothetical protein